MKTKILPTFLLLASFCLAITSFKCYGQKEVKIGSQIWMAENIEIVTFRNGDSVSVVKPIEGISENEIWEKGALEKKPHLIGSCYYNWYVVEDPRQVCPVGWHVPTIDDFKVLVKTLGGNRAAASQLKSRGGWEKYLGNNKSKFNAIPISYISYNGFYGDAEPNAIFWTSTESKTNNRAFSFRLSDYFSECKFQEDDKGNGYNIRCIKD